MSDLINRQDAIDAVEFGITYAKAFNVNTGESNELFKEGNEALKKAVERLKELPSAQPEQRWICISDKRPDVGKDVLVSVDTAESGNYWVTIAYMCHDFTDDEYWFQNDEMSFDMDEVVAWMPLPDAYEEDK